MAGWGYARDLWHVRKDIGLGAHTRGRGNPGGAAGGLIRDLGWNDPGERVSSQMVAQTAN